MIMGKNKQLRIEEDKRINSGFEEVEEKIKGFLKNQKQQQQLNNSLFGDCLNTKSDESRFLFHIHYFIFSSIPNFDKI